MGLKAQVGVKEFADIMGVDRTTISKAIATKRLDKSVVVGENGKPKITIYDACVEWFLKKNMSKDRHDSEQLDIGKSKARHEHYRSLLTQLEYEIKTAQYIPFKEVGQAGAEIVLIAKQHLLDSRYKHALSLLPITDTFDMENEIKKRDFEFLTMLSKLKDVGKKVSEKSSLTGKGE